MILYEGWPDALAGADEVHLHPTLLELAELEGGHPLVRLLARWHCTPSRSRPGWRRVRSIRGGRGDSHERCWCPARLSRERFADRLAPAADRPPEVLVAGDRE